MENLNGGTHHRMRQRLALATLLLAVGLSVQAESIKAEYYKWTDAEGQVHYSQKPPPEQQAEELKLKIHTPSPPAESPKKSEEVKVCGSLTLPPKRPDPISNIAMYRNGIKVWQKYINDRKDSRDQEALKGVADRQCAIDYARGELETLSQAEQQLQTNYEEASEELAERRQLLNDCDEIEEGEDRQIAVAECRGEHRTRVEQLEKILRSLEQPRKILQGPQ